MSKNYNINVNEIDIDDWQKFVDNNEIIEDALNSCCSNIADMIANISSINASVPGINEELGKLKTVKGPSVPSCDTSQNIIDSINEYMKDKALIIVSSISYAELAVKGFNIDEETDALFDQILQGIADANVYWIVNSLLQERLPAVGFILAYGTDIGQEGGHFAVGDAAMTLFRIGTSEFEIIKKYPKIAEWANVAVGSLAVVGITALSDVINDPGEWTHDDWKRLGIDITGSALSYAEWVIIAGALEGPVGVVVAAAFAVPTAMLINEISGTITGDKVIHTIEREGRAPIDVPINGSGKEGTFDVIIEKYSVINKKYMIGDRPYSEREYKNTMYEDVDSFIESDPGLKNGALGEKKTREVFEGALYAMLKCDTYEEGLDAYYAYFDKCMLENGNDYGAEALGRALVNQYDFDFEEYYNYNHER